MLADAAKIRAIVSTTEKWMVTVEKEKRSYKFDTCK